MYRLPIYIKSLAPVILTDNSSENVLTASKDYIPGNILRGVLAQQYLKNEKISISPVESEDFSRLFMNGANSFIAAYPSMETEENEMICAQPLPS